MLFELGLARRAWVDVTTPGATGYRRRGIRVHDGMTLHEDDVIEIDGIPCTSLARTLLDIAEDGTRREVERALDHAELARILDMRAIDDVLSRSNGRRGAKLLRAVLDEHHVGSTLTRNKLEEAFLRIARDVGAAARHGQSNGSPSPTAVAPRPTSSTAPKRLIVETDGRDAHTVRKAFKSDRIRDQRLMLLGWRVVRLPWQQVMFEPGRRGGDAARAAALSRRARPGLEPRHELAELQLLQPLADGLELGRAALDERAALAAQLERLAQPRLAGVQALDDLLQARGGRLVGERLGEQRLGLGLGLRVGHRRP